ncbi:hypothetical protein MKW98_008942 [Papaver atlanticum]|uniref:Carbohydrate kinase PfkB domain-containing protein n=1 Tax=Papaver atlanticum TaxID=357466 RepID=A0AAD4SKI2_9MAGN|nr:hypothetical protein MKW98_008942 [Papaver atlanticum]
MSSSVKIVSFGEMLIDFVPDVSGVSLADSPGFIKAPGGAPANVAFAVSKLGGSWQGLLRTSSPYLSLYLNVFGEDEFGHMLVDILKKNGVNTDGADGEREFMFYRNPSADMLLKESELNMDLIKQAKIFHYGSISLITEPCRSAHMAAMKAAKEAGALLSYDPNVRLPLWSSAEAAREGINSIWTYADVIKVSDDEVEFLTQGDATDEKNVLSLWHDGLKLLMVTDGEKGSGDAFVGSFLCSAAKDSTIFEDEEKLREVLTMANACGAICTTLKGAIPALPDTAAAQKLISSSSH